MTGERKKTSSISVIVLAVLVAHCATIIHGTRQELSVTSSPAERACEQTWAHVYVEYRNAICNRHIVVGMTVAMVHAAWGSPRDINRTLHYDGMEERWVYGLSRYVYVKNDVVTAIQE